jgi:hypothetical protein
MTRREIRNNPEEGEGWRLGGQGWLRPQRKPRGQSLLPGRKEGEDGRE